MMMENSTFCFSNNDWFRPSNKKPLKMLFIDFYKINGVTPYSVALKTRLTNAMLRNKLDINQTFQLNWRVYLTE